MSGGSEAWGDAFDFPLSGRSAKPRTDGLTMVIDKGLGSTETSDLLELAFPYIDFLKSCTKWVRKGEPTLAWLAEAFPRSR